MIGVDDVVLTLGYCPPPINCDFEQADLCSWTQMKDDDFDWLLQQGETDSFATGPTVGKCSMKDQKLNRRTTVLDDDLSL